MLYHVDGIYIDFETTGLFPDNDFPTQLAAARFFIDVHEEGPINVRMDPTVFHEFILPCWWKESDAKALDIQGMTRAEIDSRGISPMDAYHAIGLFLRANECVGLDDKIIGSRIWAHNSEFDYGFFKKLHLISGGGNNPVPHRRNNFQCTKKLFSSLGQIGIVDPSIPDNLESICTHYGIPMTSRSDKKGHAPLEDVTCGISALAKMLENMRDFHRGKL